MSWVHVCWVGGGIEGLVGRTARIVTLGQLHDPMCFVRCGLGEMESGWIPPSAPSTSSPPLPQWGRPFLLQGPCSHAQSWQQVTPDGRDARVTIRFVARRGGRSSSFSFSLTTLAGTLSGCRGLTTLILSVRRSIRICPASSPLVCCFFPLVRSPDFSTVSSQGFPLASDRAGSRLLFPSIAH